MAITLDELLGRNQNVDTNRTVENFPSFEEFTNNRSHTEEQNYSNDMNYTFDNYSNASFKDPSNRDFDNKGYSYHQNVDTRQRADLRNEYQEVDRKYVHQKPLSFYDFNATDPERLSDGELLNKLNHSNSYENVANSLNKKNQIVYKTDVAEGTQTEVKKKLKFNLKAKLILAAYVAVIIMVSALIIVNATDLNRGTVTTPAAISDYQSQSIL